MSKKPLSVVAIELGDAATGRLASWRQTLTMLGTNGLGSITETDALGRELRGAAAVAAMAELERLLRELLVATSDEINRASVMVSDLQPRLRALATQAHFQRIVQSSRSDEHWEGRAFVTTLEASTEIARFPPRASPAPQPPLDGRTINSGHVQRLWMTLGLPDNPIPNADTGASLNALSVLRNDVAHCNTPLEEVFHPDVAGKSAADIERHLRNTERLIDHICLVFADYGASRSYRK